MKHENDLNRILAVCCQRFRIEEDLVRSRTHLQSVSQCRKTCMYLMRQTGATYVSIAEFLGRDHSTIVHGVQQVEAMLRERPASERFLNEIRQEIAPRPDSWWRI